MREDDKIKRVRVALAEMATRFAEDGDVMAAATSSAAAGLVTMLEIINDTLEEIRDAIKGEE